MVCYWEVFLLKIFIDAGHGGSNPGAVGPNGLKESDVNLDVALRLLGVVLHFLAIAGYNSFVI